jgi:hypothetical protein
MTARTMLRWMHLAATIWLAACAAYLVGLGLRQVGFRWWLVFSLSGYSTFVVFLVVSFYLFALFRGIGGARRSEIEHPLTSHHVYMGLYVLTPLLGGLIALSGTLDSPGVEVSFVLVAWGTLKTTFVAWIVIDPLLGVLEMLSPTSRRHRADRLAQAQTHSPAPGKNG